MRFLFVALFALVFISPAHAATVTLDQVIERFTVDMKNVCRFEANDIAQRKASAQIFTVTSETGVSSQIFQLYCSAGAYNLQDVFYVSDSLGNLALQQFAEPVLDEKNAIIGYSTETTLTNAEFDTSKNTVSFFEKGRGIGDAFTAGRYKFEQGRFLLKFYEVDNTFDGKINPKVIIDIKK